MYFLFLFGSGIIIGLIVAAPIGPVNLICIRRTLAYGPLNGFFAGLGAALGDGMFAVVTGLGLPAISQRIEVYSNLLKLAGVLMLLRFGVHIFRTDVSMLRDAEGGPENRPSAPRAYLRSARQRARARAVLKEAYDDRPFDAPADPAVPGLHRRAVVAGPCDRIGTPVPQAPIRRARG